jgi:ComF family protein
VIDVFFGLLREFISPSQCAACDAGVPPSTLFCESCAGSVERAEQGAAFVYGGAMATAITRLKYQDRPDLAPPLARAMFPAARKVGGAIDLIVPVPLHENRLVERGFNQAALLAKPIAVALGLPMAARGLRRVRDTPKQASLPREGRIRNVVAAFRAERTFKGLRVLLIDDVSTSGATLEACAVAVHVAGAREIQALALAHA